MNARAFGVLGHPVAHSRSPAMHGAAFAALGLPHHYFAWDVAPQGLAAALAGARALGLGGLNLTVPHKQAALTHLDSLSDAARRIGAVNTVVVTPTGLHGENTDAPGFARALAELDGEVRPAGRAIVLGSGGASRAVVDALLHPGEDRPPPERLTWVSRRPQALPAVAGVTPCGWPDLPAALVEADLLVNATTVGMDGGPTDFPTPLDLPSMADGARVVDVVYPRPSAGLLDRAEAAGRPGQDGRPMLLWQGVLALEHWLDQALPTSVVEAMRTALYGCAGGSG